LRTGIAMKIDAPRARRSPRKGAGLVMQTCRSRECGGEVPGPHRFGPATDLLGGTRRVSRAPVVRFAQGGDTRTDP
jgi:hypothetical protein